MRGDGDGWAFSATGARYWGRFGAAGLLLRAPLADGTPAVLLQHRAWWSHQGGTWALPGGARDSHETPEQAAVREAGEEAGVPAYLVAVRAALITADVGTWTYTTVVADATEPLTVQPNQESTELRWVPESQVTELPLHSGFASSWPRLRTAVAAVPLEPDDERRRHLPRTVVIESEMFLWATAGEPDLQPSRLSEAISELLPG